MRLLVLGGTAFLSRAVAAEAVSRGHSVLCASRGESGAPPRGADHAPWDRAAEPVPPALRHGDFDAVIDVARRPGWVRDAVAGVRCDRWVFVSSISVYADASTPRGRPDTLPTLAPLDADVDPMTSPETYGAMKAACENLVREQASSSVVVRPGLIVGPGDPTGRFTYWVDRLLSAAAGEPVLAPGDPTSVVQVIDVRDLATWLVDLADNRLDGVFDAIGPPTSMADVLAQVATGVGAEPSWVWCDDGTLHRLGVQPWMGEDSLPLWLPRPEFDGMLDHDDSPSHEAGLISRPITDTARSIADWVQEDPDAQITGMSRAREREVLDAVR